MKRAIAGGMFAAFCCSAAFGQSTETTPKFDIADVHPSPHTTNPNPYLSGGVLRAGRYDLRRATMLDLITTAWGVDADTVLGGPNWLETDRFDVIARAPSSTPPETVKLMLRSLLADRFKLVVHQDTKPLPGFALTVGKGKPKLKEASGTGSPGCQPQPQNPDPGAVPYAVVSCRAITMADFARSLRGMAGAYLTNPVVDSTGLKGSWDFDLKWHSRGLIASAGADGITIFDAIDKQLGLKLELQKVPAPVIVVDSVNQKPTDNPPGVTTSLPPSVPTEFEVADIKLSMPDARPFGRIQPGGRLDLQGFTLKQLINIAWDINDDEMLVGAPKWIDSTRYNVLAKASTAISGSATDLQIDIDDLRVMLRALLVERFRMATHNEDRPVTAYSLVAVKPKLAKADPANRTGCKEAPAAPKDPRDTNPALARLITCQNLTMAQFAEKLQGLAPGYIHNPVLDATALDGAWDFTLSFSTAGFLQQGNQAAGGGAGRGGDGSQVAGAGTPTASDPSGGMSLFDAVNKRLGLKLELHKRVMPVLVIDHVEEKPTDN